MSVCDDPKHHALVVNQGNGVRGHGQQDCEGQGDEEGKDDGEGEHVEDEGKDMVDRLDSLRVDCTNQIVVVVVVSCVQDL